MTGCLIHNTKKNHHPVMNFKASKDSSSFASARPSAAKGSTDRMLECEYFYRHVIDSAVDGFFRVDTRNCFIEVNDRLCELFGYTREEMLGRSPFEFITEECRETLAEQIRRIPSTDHRRYQLTGARKNGSTFPILINTTTHCNIHGELTGSFGFATDLTPIVEAQRAVAESERELRRILDNMQDTYYRTDTEGRVVRVSPSVSDLLGYAPEEFLGLRLADLYVEPNGREAFLRALQAGDGRVTGYEAPLRHKKGHAVWVMTNAQFVRDDQGTVVGVEGTTRDISERRRAQERIDFLAHHDPLTELPNRLLFKDRFERAMMHDHRLGTRSALLFIDLDSFKPINDRYGHHVGDRVLREVALRLNTCVRGTDTVSRQGGDEFLVALTDMHDGDAAIQVANKVLSVLGEPFVVDAHEMTVGASLGIVVSPDDGLDFEELLRKADTAMYAAKHAGGNTFRFFGAA